MHVVSEHPLVAEKPPSVGFRSGSQAVQYVFVEDEEFPSDLPGNYDRMLQPGSSSKSHRILALVALMVVVLLVAMSVYVLHTSSKSSAFVFASHSSSSR